MLHYHSFTKEGKMLKKSLIVPLIIFSSFYCLLTANEIVIENTRQKSTFTDTKTQLVWQDDIRVTRMQMTWENATLFCNALTLDGYDDWMLPSKEQLQTISLQQSFKFKAQGYYWSSSEETSHLDFAWDVDFTSGYAYYRAKDYRYQVRCLRHSPEIFNFSQKVKNTLTHKVLQTSNKKPAFSLTQTMFETSQEFNIRLKSQKFVNHLAVLKNQSITQILEEEYGKPTLYNLQYDPENSYFTAELKFDNKTDNSVNVAISIAKKDAPSFYTNRLRLKPRAIFQYTNNEIKLKRIEVLHEKKVHIALLTDKVIQHNLKSIDFSSLVVVDEKITSPSLSKFNTKNLKSYAELDHLLLNTPQATTDETKWLFVIGIEQYQYTNDITFAKRSAQMFTKVLQKVKGVPLNHTYMMLNHEASQANIKTNLKKMLRKVHPQDTIYFYYNGHGIPIPKQRNEPYILAADSDPEYIQDEAFFALQNVYSLLSHSKAKKVIAVIDSCFTGVTDGVAILKGVAATKLVPKRLTFNQENMAILYAGKDYQYSNAFETKGHRIFSFYIMKNILEGSTRVNTLFSKTRIQTYNTSYETFGDLRVQEPTLKGNKNLTF